MQKINLAEKLSLIRDHWNPRIAGELNGQLVKLVKFQGPFTWHHHENEDEMFLVVKGRFRMDFREKDLDREEWVEQGEFVIVPRGVEHRPFAEEECEVLLFEPASGRALPGPACCFGTPTPPPARDCRGRGSKRDAVRGERQERKPYPSPILRLPVA